MTAVIRPGESEAGWGMIPTLGGNVATSTPDPVTGTSATQTQQETTATVQAVAQKVFLPPAPTWSPLLDQNGTMSAPWVTWFQTLNRKMGGYNEVFLSAVTVSAPFTGNGTVTTPLAMPAATATADGYLAKADWTTFNGKQNAIPYTTADDSKVVHNTGNESIAGDKTASGKWSFQQVGFFGTAALAAKPSALTAVTADAPAGGTGTAAGGWDTAAHRDTAIALINNLKTRVGELENRLQSLGLLT